MLGRGAGCQGSRLLRTEASGAPAFGQYRLGADGRHRAWALISLDVSAGRIANMVSFLDTASLFPRFGLPLELPA
jgi:RNA polymerase sigma-70 factor (ECF subfamily)